jgi:hypothetical protein
MEEHEPKENETMEDSINADNQAIQESGEVTKRTRKIPKKPVSKWILFLNEHRSECAKENPGLSVADITKLLSDQYKVISTEESQRLDELLQKQKAEWEAYQSEFGGETKESSVETSKTSLQFPLVSCNITVVY